MTKVNDAMLAQYGATRESFLGTTPKDLFRHDLPHGRRVWREFFDRGRLHVETDERRLDGTPIKIEGDYLCFYDAAGPHYRSFRHSARRHRTRARQSGAAPVQPAAAGASRHPPGHPRHPLAAADRRGDAASPAGPDSVPPRQRRRLRPAARHWHDHRLAATRGSRRSGGRRRRRDPDRGLRRPRGTAGWAGRQLAQPGAPGSPH